MESALALLSQDAWNELMAYLPLDSLCRLHSTRCTAVMRRITSNVHLSSVTVHVHGLKELQASPYSSFTEVRFLLSSLQNLTELRILPTDFKSAKAVLLNRKWLHVAPNDRITRLTLHDSFAMDVKSELSMRALFPSLQSLSVFKPEAYQSYFKPSQIPKRYFKDLPPTLTELAYMAPFETIELPSSLTKAHLAAHSIASFPVNTAYHVMSILSQAAPNLKSLCLEIWPESISAQTLPVNHFPCLESLHFKETKQSRMNSIPVQGLDAPLLHTLSIETQSTMPMWMMLPHTLIHLSIFLTVPRTTSKLLALNLQYLPPLLESLFLVGQIEVESNGEATKEWFTELPRPLTSLIIPPNLVNWNALPPHLERLIVSPTHATQFKNTTSWPEYQPSSVYFTANAPEQSEFCVSIPLPARLTELQTTAPRAINPTRMDLLPTSLEVLRIVDLAEDWKIENVNSLLEARPGLSLTFMGGSTHLPLPPIELDQSYSDNMGGSDVFKLSVYVERIAPKKRFARAQLFQVNALWALPDDFMLPDNLKTLDCALRVAMRPGTVDQMIERNLPRLASLTSLIYSDPTPPFFQQSIDLASRLMSMPNLTLLKLKDVQISGLNFGQLPRGLLSLEIPLPDASSSGFSGFSHGVKPPVAHSPKNLAAYNPADLPPTLTSLKIIAFSFSWKWANLTWPQALEHLELNVSHWGDVHSDLLRKNLPKLQALFIHTEDEPGESESDEQSEEQSDDEDSDDYSLAFWNS